MRTSVFLLLLAASFSSAETPLPPLVMPPRPAVIPGYTELDPSTGLHMTGTPQFLKTITWRLAVTGKVDHPLRLTYDELRRLPRLASKDPLTCRGNFEDYAAWAGADLQAVLERAGPRRNARRLVLVGADGYSTEVALEAAKGAFLAYEWNGKALPELHGFPLRAVFPGAPGYDWVKWLVSVRVE